MRVVNLFFSHNDRQRLLALATYSISLYDENYEWYFNFEAIIAMSKWKTDRLRHQFNIVFEDCHLVVYYEFKWFCN